jgi:inorganic pyrophosphatase
MKEQIDSAAAGIKVYEKIEDDTTQAKAQSLRSRLLELSGEADKKREAEKKPFLEGGKSVDKKWKPLVDAAKNAADAIRAAMSSWETTKANKAKAERDEAEKKARAASAEAEKAGKPVAIVHVPPPPPAPLNVKGAYGRAAAVKPVKFVSKVTDLDALFVYFKAYGEVEECLLDLARKYVKRYPESTPPPGVEVVDKMDVR